MEPGTDRRSQGAPRTRARPPRHGSYVLQAAITDLHLQEPHDWEQIALLYQRLEHITGSPVVTMNRAIAVAELEGPAAALVLLDRLELDDYRYYHSTRADLLRRLGRNDEARAAYTRAARANPARAGAAVPPEPPRRPPGKRRTAGCPRVIGDRWGVTQTETTRRYPCDELVPEPVLQAWRGVTVRAKP